MLFNEKPVLSSRTMEQSPDMYSQSSCKKYARTAI